MRPLSLAPPVVAGGALAHGGHLHLVAESVVGILVGAGFVAVYLATLRWLDSDHSSDGTGDRVGRSAEQRSQEP